jgi:hypothetical protein
VIRDEHTLLQGVEESKQAFGVKCGKFSGSVTVQLLRSALQEAGIDVSSRDVFIRGVSVEIDLLVPKRNATPDAELVYDPSDVLAAIEVKNSGSFGDGTLESTRKCFARIRAANPNIECMYVTLMERKGFKWAATRENLGADVYTLFWHSGSAKTRRYEATGDWARLVNSLNSLERANQ